MGRPSRRLSTYDRGAWREVRTAMASEGDGQPLVAKISVGPNSLKNISSASQACPWFSPKADNASKPVADLYRLRALRV